MGRLPKRNCQKKDDGHTELRSFKIVLDRCSPTSARQAADRTLSKDSSSRQLRGRSGFKGNPRAGKSTGKTANKKRPNKPSGSLKKKNVNTRRSTGRNLNGKKRGSLESEAIAKKRAKFFKSYEALEQENEKTENQSDTISQDASTMARASENAGYRLRGRFKNLRTHKPSLRTVKVVESSTLTVLVDKSNDVQPVERGTRSRRSPYSKNVQSEKRPSTRSSVSPIEPTSKPSRKPSRESNRKPAQNATVLAQVKPFTIKLVRLLNCLICGEPLDTATHTCKS